MARRTASHLSSSNLPSRGASRAASGVHRWTRLSSVKWEDAWAERLRFLGPENIVFVSWPNSKALKIEAYCSERRAKQLVRRFGGRAAKLPAHIWTGDPAHPRGPLSIRGRLKVFSDPQSWRQWKRGKFKIPGILIPAGMAFGTGEHATTATCLRLLADLVQSLPGNFTALDLGTGAGILAIAASALDASKVEAVDHDPIAVRIAKQNASTNGFPAIRISRGDVLKLTARKPFDIVLANLFSDVLLKAAPRIARATKPGGWLIFSGVLRDQAPEVATAFQDAGFAKPRILTRGKWCAGICHKEQSKAAEPADSLN
jgi:ribosomal protein L11 methyltransferase